MCSIQISWHGGVIKGEKSINSLGGNNEKRIEKHWSDLYYSHMAKPPPHGVIST